MVEKKKIELIKKVREFAGLSSWKMMKLLNRRSIQSYLAFERNAKSISLEDFYALQRVFIEAGGSKDEFERLANGV